MKKNSKTNQSTEEKDEKMKTIEDIRKHLNKYENIKNSKDFTVRQKDILSLMLFRGNGQDEGFTMGYKHITETFGYSSTAISSAISLFKDYNFISVEKGHTGVNSKYTLNYDAMKSFKSSSTVSVSDSNSETKSEKRSKIREEKTYDTVIQLLTRLLSDLQIREEKRRESEMRYIADIQALIRLLSDKFDTVIDLINQRLNININNNINKNLNNLKDNISNNNNTEGNNTKDQNKKKNISTGNLEKLKENSNDEIFNDEDIQRENEILNKIENTSKDKLLDNENPDNENNIPSDEKDNSKVESSKNEISNDENTLNENYDFSILENMYLNEGPSVESQINEMPKDNPPLDIESMEREFWGESTEYRAMNSSKENEDLNENSKDEISTDENSKDNEILEYSIFGDEIPQDNENQNTVKFIDGKFQVVEQVKDKINLNLSEMKNSKEKSQTIENVKTVKGEISNDLNSSKENENFNVFGKLQLIRDLNSGRVDGYLFNAYDNLTAAKDYSKSFHAAIINRTIESSDLKASVSDTGTWGMLSRKDGVYSFTASNTDLSDGKYIKSLRSLTIEKKGGEAVETEKTSNNAHTSDENAKVGNYTTEDEKVDSTQSQNTNKASEGNTNTTADNKKDEKATEMPNADEKNTKVDNCTTNEEITAGNSVKMRPEASDSNTNTTDTPNNGTQAPKTSEVDNHTTEGEKIDSTQSQNTNKASNAYADACYDMYGISTDELNDIIGHHHCNGKGAWRNMTIKLHNEETTISKALDHFKDKKEDGKEFMECNTFFYYFDPICFEVDRLHNRKQMTDEQFKDCCDIICKLTRGKTNYWRNTFSHRSPRPNFPSEKRMWELVGCPSVTNKNINNVVDNNKVYEDNVILPTHKDFETMNLDDIKNHLLSFVQEHPNLSDDKKKYVNDLCMAYALEPQYVA